MVRTVTDSRGNRTNERENKWIDHQAVVSECCGFQ